MDGLDSRGKVRRKTGSQCVERGFPKIRTRYGYASYDIGLIREILFHGFDPQLRAAEVDLALESLPETVGLVIH